MWDEKLQKYKPPATGLRFYTCRYEPSTYGMKKRVFKTLRTLTEAKSWQAFQYDPVDMRKAYKTPTEIGRIKNIKLKREGGELRPQVEKVEGYTFFHLWEDFKKRKFPLIGRATQLNYLKHGKLFSFFYPYEVSKISPKVINEWVKMLKSPRMMKTYKESRYGFKKDLKCLNSVFNWYIQDSLISNWSNPIRKVHYDMSKIKANKEKARNYMTEEEKNLWYNSLKKVSPNFFAPAFIQTEQVMRVGETFAMVWENLDLRNKAYHVTHHVVWERVRSPIPYLTQGTKTQKGGFVMPLRKPVINLLKDLYKKRNKKSKYIFHDENGGIINISRIDSAYNKAFRKAGLPFSGTHVCRHTGATQFLEKTGDPLALQEAGNWKTQDQALHYGKILKQRLRRAIDKMDEESSL